MTKLDDFRLLLGSREYKPLIIGGMGVNISTADLALGAARLGGIGHISDAMSPYLSDTKLRTKFQAEKVENYRARAKINPKAFPIWPAEIAYRANRHYVSGVMSRKVGDGAVFVNVMEKLTMGAPIETLKARLTGALDGGIDGITLSAGLHNSSFKLMEDHPRFRDALLGIIVSSVRALKIFLRGAKRSNRMPDYIVVEGPLAGGHLGFGLDWKKHNLKDIVVEVIRFLKEEGLDIPIIPAGGVFTGTDAVNYLKMGAAAVQVATRFTISRECGLPEKVKQIYLASEEDDVVVNTSSPTGYPMRMLKSSPSLHSNVRPNCETLGYILDKDGHCAYKDLYPTAPEDKNGEKLPIAEKMCICTHFMKYNCYTCGHNVYRLKDTTVKKEDGTFYLPSMEEIFLDYISSEDNQIKLPQNF